MRTRWYRYWEQETAEVQGEEPEAAPPPFHVEPAPAASAHSPASRGPADVETAPFHVEPARSRRAGPSPTHVEHVPEPSPPVGDVRPPTTPTPKQTPRRVDAGAAPATESRAFARAKVLTIANQKGGVGKTTTAVSLAAALADLGCRVLLIDLDPQGNATSGVGVRVEPGRPTVYDVLVEGADIDDVVEPTSIRNLFLVPANIDLAGAEVELVSAFSREQKLRRALEPARPAYDVIFIDCPPSLGLLTVNALTAGDGVIVPIQCEYYALEGLGALRRNTELIQTQLNPDLDIVGFVMTMLDGRTRLGQQVIDEVTAHFGERVFRTRIPRSVRLAEAPGFGQPITVFDPSSRGAMAYRRLAGELLERLRNTEAGDRPPESVVEASNEGGWQ